MLFHRPNPSKHYLKFVRQAFLFFCCLPATMIVNAQIKVGHLLCENKPEPLGVDAATPRLSWQLESVDVGARGLSQTGYEIRVAEGGPGFKGALVWSSGKVSSDKQVQVAYEGKPLVPGQIYYWQVRVWDNKGRVSAWSGPSFWRMGLLQSADWKAQWIEPGYVEDSVLRPSPLLRKGFTVSKKLRSALAYISAHGLYEAYLNGKKVGDACLTPGWTSYNKRLQYQVYDVTTLLEKGSNAVGVMLGSGWYRGTLAWADQHNIFGRTLGLLFQLELTYADGTKEYVLSDGSWKSSTGAITYSEVYNGEIIDARKEKKGWNEVGYNDMDWTGVKAGGMSRGKLVATWNEPVKKHEVFKPLKIFKTPAGELVVDFGQNLVGWVKLRVRGAAGDSVKLYHAEVLDKFGNFYTDNLRKAKQENIYVLNGEGQEVFEPHFSWQGFRYVRVVGFPGELKAEDLEATALYSDMPQTGEFACSNVLLNQLQHNITWGQRGNFLDVPTDCPQRDERLGWTGDAQVFCRTAAFNRQVNNFFAKWLQDVAADQFASGAVPHVVPNVLGVNDGGSAGWSDVATIVPWTMYLVYGDKKILEDQYASMKAWVGFMEQNSDHYLWNKGGHFGDWLSYWPEGHGERAAITDSYLIAQAFFAHSVQLVIDAAKVLGREEDVTHYGALLKQVKDAFLREYATPSGRLVCNTQTAYVLALAFDLLPEAVRASAAERLVNNIKDYDDHLTTGFLGTPYLCHVLSNTGHTDIAYKLLLQEGYPSWLYPVKMGATTIWERWDGQKPDSTFEDIGMNSFNHYAYGAIGDWMYQVMAGIDTYAAYPGYKKIKLMPHPGGGLTYVNASLQTYYGLVSSVWKQLNGKFLLDVTVPVNTTADIYIPGEMSKVTESGVELASRADFRNIRQEGEYTVVEVGSGYYRFQVGK
ncbi:MAG TPA: family 78 glycoside hydrolase catalytic domain [Puia sp.]|nr:family 78 glycoside hydrolase catalytic domain [Puia sp.]